MILCGLDGGFFEAFCNGRDLLAEHAMDGRSAHQMGLRQLAQLDRRASARRHAAGQARRPAYRAEGPGPRSGRHPPRPPAGGCFRSFSGRSGCDRHHRGCVCAAASLPSKLRYSPAHILCPPHADSPRVDVVCSTAANTSTMSRSYPSCLFPGASPVLQVAVSFCRLPRLR